MQHFMPAAGGLQTQVRGTDGKLKNVLLRYGPELEPDPARPGYARLKTNIRGSVFRSGKSYCALGLPENEFPATGGILVPAGTTAQFNFKDAIQEPGHLGHLYVMGVPTTATLYLTDVSRYGDSLMSGNVPLNIFQRDSVYNPVFGHYIDPNTQLTITFRNRSAGDLQVAPGFSLI